MAEDVTVSCLLAPFGGWNIPLLKEIFSVDDVNLILKIPICLDQRKDGIIWHYEENGRFSVRSGYWIGNSSSSSNSGLLNNWWKSFWKSKIPIKIKIFVWRACNDWIPTKANIARRGVQTNGRCDACKCSTETTLHSLWECAKLKYIQDEWWYGRHPLRGNYSNFFELIWDISSIVTKEEMYLFYVMVWRIWFCRNSNLHGGQIHNVQDVFCWSKDFMIDFRSLVRGSPRGEVRRNEVVCRWQPPEDGVYKANCDVVVDMGGNRVGVGTVIRDSTGAVFAFCSQILEANFTIKVAKLVAIQKCLHFGINCGLSPCIIESDEASVVKWINDGDMGNSVCDTLLSDISSTISNLNGVTFGYVHKRFNKVAQALAKNALGISENAYWMENYPGCISKEIDADMPG
ncbi:hypothetical protein Dsin_016097 [Dipteronia sinensis]|uniref:Uncharacterized protein n=1 Tax=Dipteronia sinensis TaxID=43782 RepID=A0AAE0ACF8_9ROSI|nr:hypothetical protein Dsin_016097 [Dipteronia sinensis]